MTDQELADKARTALREAAEHLTELLRRGYRVECKFTRVYYARLDADRIEPRTHISRSVNL